MLLIIIMVTLEINKIKKKILRSYNGYVRNYRIKKKILEKKMGNI